MKTLRARIDLILIVAVYTLAHGLLLLNKGWFWDDWVICHNDPLVVRETFRQAGGLLAWPIHQVLLRFGSVFPYRAITFGAFLLAALCLNGILRRFKEVDNRARLLIVLCFATLPVNSARIAMVTLPSAICYVLFFVGAWLITRQDAARRPAVRGLSLVTFATSFVLSSFLVFFVLVLLYLIYQERERAVSLGAAARRLLRYPDFLALPFAFWAIRTHFFVASGLYQKYNQISVGNLPFAIGWGAFTFYSSFLVPIVSSLGAVSLLLLIGGLFLSAAADGTKIGGESPRRQWPPFLVGVIAFLAGVFPYLIVRDVPQAADWSSRHQILVPLGAALMFYYGLTSLFEKAKVASAIQSFVFSVAVLLFVSADIRGYIAFEKDWYKQLALREDFVASDVMRNSTTFLFTDQTLDLNANRRTYRFYEYTGLMKAAFGDETRFGENSDVFRDFTSYVPMINAGRNIHDFQWRPPQVHVTIAHGEEPLDDAMVLRLMVGEWRGAGEPFQARLRGILRLTFAPLGTDGVPPSGR